MVESSEAQTREAMSSSLYVEFHTALAEAIKRRGIGLSRIRAHLQSRGVNISVATLSYWQSGRSRPERAESLQALEHLEQVLEVPRGSLACLIGPPRPRGRAAKNAKAQPNPDDLLPERDATLEMLSKVNLPGYRSLTKLSLHEQILIGADGVCRYQFVRQVFRAEQDGIPGFPVLMKLTDVELGVPRVSPTTHCHVRNVTTDPQNNLLVAEIMFDEPLNRGDATMVEFLIEKPAGGQRLTYHERIATCPIRELLMDIRFAGPMPSNLTRYERINDLETTRAIDSNGPSVQLLYTDWGPGLCGLRWDYNTSTEVQSAASEATF